MQIRSFRPEDWPDVWAILKPVFRAGDTYGVSPEISPDEARRLWTDAPKSVFVAEEVQGGPILGTYYLRPNGYGPASHVCNCGYVVAGPARGQGLATAMCEHSQAEARRRGYRAMQFNLVASSNRGALLLWEKLGFEKAGTLPGAFRHPSLGFVDAFVMFKHLSGEDA
jgi:ribosomal protein S18 acetylase RimI-like enzyme